MSTLLIHFITELMFEIMFEDGAEVNYDDLFICRKE